MPTFEAVDSFVQQYRSLSKADQKRFRTAVAKFVADLRAGGRIRPGLQVNRIQGMDGCFEMTWAPGQSRDLRVWTSGPGP